MNKLLLLAGFGMAMVMSVPAFAQNVRTDSAAQAIAIAGGGGSGSNEFSGRYTVNNVPSLGSMAVALANNCAMVHGGQAVVAGFGIGAQATTESDECNRRATAAAYWAMGQRDMALEIMEESTFATRARQRLTARPTQVASVPAVRAVEQPQAPGCPSGTAPLPAPYSHICR